MPLMLTAAALLGSCALLPGAADRSDEAVAPVADPEAPDAPGRPDTPADTAPAPPTPAGPTDPARTTVPPQDDRTAAADRTAADDRVAAVDPARPADRPEDRITIRKVGGGLHSAVRVPVARAVDLATNWQDVWAVIHANQADPPPVPTVDFARETVLVVLLGDRPTGGYAVEVTAVRRVAGGFEADVAVTAPGPEDMVTQAFTSPWTAVAIPFAQARVRFTGDDIEEGFVGD